MHLTLRPLQLPFTVGDTVFVNIPYSSLILDSLASEANDPGYFEAIITRIFLEGLKAGSVISGPKEQHELVISSVIYDLMPTGPHRGLGRVAINVESASSQIQLFATAKALLDADNHT